ncbi:MAG: RnfABCDGE type electron transport complex subunit B [Ruminococcaceae bacterium]|nr:RnfABCDGE type electron transport complex subunit B [Oscillospiraceae bacterium]
MITDILTAVAVVAAVGIICAVLLALASHFMSVKSDERVGSIRECLPGANCGACGYTGCDSYAKAIVEEGAKTNLCVPGATAVAEKVAAILGVEADAVESRTAFVHCNGHNGAAEEKAIYEGIKSCKSECLIYGGSKACTYACVGCGDCASVCPKNAICVEDGVARINKKLCIGCGLCVKTCPKGIISLIPTDAKAIVICSNKEKGAVVRKECTNGCIACKKCEKTCPSDAIHVENDLAVIDYGKCISCGKCAEVCPVGCIIFSKEK